MIQRGVVNWYHTYLLQPVWGRCFNLTYWAFPLPHFPPESVNYVLPSTYLFCYNYFLDFLLLLCKANSSFLDFAAPLCNCFSCELPDQPKVGILILLLELHW